MSRLALPVAALLLLAGCAPSPTGPAISVVDAWARATAPGQSSGAIYATIANAGAADTLVGVSSDAGMAMLHSNDMSGGVARMRMLGDLAIPASGRVALAPGGTHIMLSGLKAPLTAGGDLDVTLRFATAGPRTVKVTIVAPGAR
jgi:copper(I)-binding protein